MFLEETISMHAAMMYGHKIRVRNRGAICGKVLLYVQVHYFFNKHF